MSNLAGLAVFITALATLITSIGGVLVSLRNSRKIIRVQETTDGKMEEFIQEVREASTRPATAANVKNSHAVQRTLEGFTKPETVRRNGPTRSRSVPRTPSEKSLA